MADNNIKPQAILDFWLGLGSEKWYVKDEAVDQKIITQFLEAHERASAGDLDDWEENAEGALALLILLDQFPRNMFRGSARSFATDPKALGIAKRAVENQFHFQVQDSLRQFFILPLMHSEALEDQDACLAFSEEHLDEININYAHIHRDIIVQFGRFPHRNDVLGRETTKEEQAFLDEGGFQG